MPCPYFEPRLAVAKPARSNARLPLIEEYEGVCHACPDPAPLNHEAQFRFCNHGNAERLCSNFPREERRTSVRFDVVKQSAQQLQLLLIEEASYAPLAWRRHSFSIESERIEPDPENACRRAQLLAFCRSYLRRYPV